MLSANSGGYFDFAQRQDLTIGHDERCDLLHWDDDMSIFRQRHHMTGFLMAAVTTVTSLPVDVAQAGMISTRTIIDSRSSPHAQPATAIERFRTLLARDDVRAQMVMLGVDPAEAALRVNALTDEELILLAGRLEELPAGEGAMTTFALVALIITVVVLLASRISSGGGRACSYRYHHC
ncbi:MAG: PA2779 family protein [Geminicoccaceae bacterium]